MRVTVRAKLVVGYLELVTMESGDDNSSEQDTSTATNDLKKPEAKRKRNLWWKE